MKYAMLSASAFACLAPSIAVAAHDCYIFGDWDCTGTCGGQVKVCQIPPIYSESGNISILEWETRQPLCITYSLTIPAACDNPSLSAAGWSRVTWCEQGESCCWSHYDFSDLSHEGLEQSFPVDFDGCLQTGGQG